MTTPTHIASGFLITQGLVYMGVIPQDSARSYLMWSLLMANGPDFDVINVRKAKNHRQNSLMHMPLLWLCAFGIAFLLIKLLSLEPLTPYLWIGLLQVAVHFILDSFDASAGIMWFAPFSKRLYSARKTITPHCVYNIWRYCMYYIRQPVMFFEILIWIAAATIWFHSVPTFTRKVEATSPAARRVRLSDIIRLKPTIKPDRFQR